MEFRIADTFTDSLARLTGGEQKLVKTTAFDLLLCYVDHHDKAYAWAERRKLETHPATGAAQLVEIRERVQEIVVPTGQRGHGARAGGPPAGGGRGGAARAGDRGGRRRSRGRRRGPPTHSSIPTRAAASAG